MARAVVMTSAVVVALGLGVGAAGTVGRSATPTGATLTRAAETSGGTGAAGPDDAGGVHGADVPPGNDARGVLATSYVAPVDPPVVVTRPFDAPPQPWAAGHRGVDLSARPGQAVRAPQGGVVTFAGTVVDRGVLTVTHPDGLRSSLEPVTPSVRTGQRVLRGQVVGTVSSVAGHCGPATCLHWGLRRGATYLDPMRWVLDRGPIVLLPAR